MEPIWRWNVQFERLGRGLGYKEFPPGPCDEIWARCLQGVSYAPCVERGVRGAAHGVPGGVDRIACLGNAVVPSVAQWIGERILESLPSATFSHRIPLDAAFWKV